jgi:predicted permease
MSNILPQVLQLFLMIGTGWLVKKTKVINDDHIKGFSRLLVMVTLPALSFASLQREFSPDRLNLALLALAVSAACHALFIGVALLTAPAWGPKGIRGIYQFALVFGNTAFMGFPVIEAVAGPDALYLAVIFNIPFLLLLFTLGVHFFEEGHRTGPALHPRLLLSPGIIATVAGFLFFLFRIPLPGLVLGAVRGIGGITTPLSMIIVGALLADIHPADLFSGFRVYAASLTRMVLFPVLVGVALYPVFGQGELFKTAVILSSMPVAANASMMAQAHGAGGPLPSRLVFMTTLMSLVTLPALILLLGLIP